MRKRKIRQWMREQYRIETGRCLPYRYENKLCVSVGTDYYYMITNKRKWLKEVVDGRCLRNHIFYLHQIISFKPTFLAENPGRHPNLKGVK